MRLFRKQMIACLCMSMLAVSACTAKQDGEAKEVKQANTEEKEDGNMEEYYTFTLSENVKREHVSYKNRYGIQLAADLYTPQDFDRERQYPALIIGAPYGGVKEQGPGVYANQLAQRGFVVLTFDASFNGYSEGEPHHISSPDIFVEDFSAGVDYLGVQTYVDRENIGAIGICGSGGFALSAAQVDTRIKAVTSVVMYDISATGNDMTADERKATLDEISKQRWADFESDAPHYIPSFPEVATDAIPEGLDDISSEFYSYYGLKRGHHPNARGGFSTTSQLPWLNFRLLDHIETISPRPILFIVGDRAHSRGFSETAYEAATQPKEMYVVEDANHVDLYDRLDRIPFDKIETFFMDAFQNQ